MATSTLERAAVLPSVEGIPPRPPKDPVEALRTLGVRPDRPDTVPFACGDATGGSETELQAAVIGQRSAVDLPLTIEGSNYFANTARRMQSGDVPRRAMNRLEDWLDRNGPSHWDHSWVRLPVDRLSEFAKRVFEADLRADKSDPQSGPRNDAGRFLGDGGRTLRVPISYLLKLALADVVAGDDGSVPPAVRVVGEQLFLHFLSDNTSPETVSFHVEPIARSSGNGRALAREAAKRFLLSQLLVAYANSKLGLADSGQAAQVYASPHPPVRQRELNDCISDSFYRELFMNPCLSGWDLGEAKHEYMALCHRTLSRSQLNAVQKLREAGVITRNLVVLPNTSNTCLANNGVHVSLGSRILGKALESGTASFGPAEEKRAGDLAIKLFEHFLPLFVGTYSASPYRLDFEDFHPEKLLAFLPHQLDYTHLRMIWRRWRRKARIRVLGRSICPTGPYLLDRLIARLFHLRGDLVPDIRLLDYLVSPMSTKRSPALDGELGNEQRLLRDLDDLGVFDSRMAFYLLYRLRQYQDRGFSGFEGRHYSLFESLRADFSHAVNLQALVTALAYQYIASGRYSHSDVPDRPSVESERRQIVFGAAIGLPTFFVRSDSPNRVLMDIAADCDLVRSSRRYPGYLRIYQREYRRALVRLIETDAKGLIEAMGLQGTLADLESRLDDPADASAEARLTRGVLAMAGGKDPMRLSAREYNLAAESYYRGPLRRRYMSEALAFVMEDLSEVPAGGGSAADLALKEIAGDRDPALHLDRIRDDLLAERLPAEGIRWAIHLLLALEARRREELL